MLKNFPRNISKCFLQKRLVIALKKICYNRHSDDFPTPFLSKFLQLPYYKALTSQLLAIKLLLADYLVFHTDFISIGDTMLCNTLGGGGRGGNSYILKYRMCHLLRVLYGRKMNFWVYFIACDKLFGQDFSFE